MATRSGTSKKAAKPPVAEPGGKGASELIARHRRALPALQAAARSAAERLHRDRVLQPGSIVLHSGSGAGGFMLKSSEGGVELQALEAGADSGSARIEVICDPARLTSIIEGKKDARMQFFAGGIRVRGDMAYLSEIGLRLGFLDRPLV
jgi:hypothetical protein